jgi:hypothetical protein
VAYIPDWEPLADALQRVMATGASEDESKTDLCRAVADRKVDVRVRIAASDFAMGGRIFSKGNVSVPLHLDPRDFDWAQSRPLAQWRIGPRPGEHYVWISGWEGRPVDLIELSTADVMRIFCGAKDGQKSLATARIETDAIKALASRLKGDPQITRVKAAEWCRASGYNLSARGFQSRVWPKARIEAGLGPTAKPGRKGKSSH